MTQTTVYATPAELASWMDPDAAEPTVPPLATVLLRSASALVTRNLSAAYRTDQATGLPSDPEQAAAIKTATLQMAEAWSLHGIDPRKGAAQTPRRVASKSLNGASVSYVADGQADTALTALAAGDTLTDEAWYTLSEAGLIATTVGTVAGGYVRPLYRIKDEIGQ
jgi:hypothetical protein